jgi:hypothetical protein
MPMRPLHLLHLAPAVIVEGIVHLTAVIGRREGSGDGTVSTVVQRGTHSICSSGSVTERGFSRSVPFGELSLRNRRGDGGSSH